MTLIISGACSCGGDDFSLKIVYPNGGVYYECNGCKTKYPVTDPKDQIG